MGMSDILKAVADKKKCIFLLHYLNIDIKLNCLCI